MPVRTLFRPGLPWWVAGALAGLLSSSVQSDTNVTLGWDLNTEADLAGYEVYYGAASGSYTNVIRIGPVATVTVSNLVVGATYFFAVKAYNTEDLKSDFSDEVSYRPVQSGPAISPIADQTISANASTPQLTFQLTGWETPLADLRLSGSSSNPTLVPVSAIVFGGSGNNRTVQITPALNRSGTAVIAIIATDSRAVASNSFTLTVQGFEELQTPILIDEQTTLSLPIGTTEPDLSGRKVTWQLDRSAPEGLSVNPATGWITWTPTEEQGPSTNTVAVIARRNGAPHLNESRTLTIVVNEVNRPPVLAAVSDQTSFALATTIVPIKATDPDLPANRLTFRLDPGAPVGARINSQSGVLTWTPSRLQAPSTNTFRIRVTDDGVPALYDTATFTVVVTDYLELLVSSGIVQAGQTGSVAIAINSTAAVTNLAFTLDTSAPALTDFSLAPLARSVSSAALRRRGPQQLDVNLAAQNGKRAFYGGQILSLLRFRAGSNEPSAFIALRVSNLSASQLDDVGIQRALSQDGRVVLIGDTPLLEARNDNSERRLFLYAPAGPIYTVQCAPVLTSPIQWSTVWSGPVTNLVQVLDPPFCGPHSFYRMTAP